MADFPGVLVRPSRNTISTAGEGSQVGEYGLIFSSTFSAGAVWPAANTAHYVPVVVQTTVTAYKLAVVVTTQNGNLDVGIYDVTGVRLVSSGSTAVAAAGIQIVDIADTVLTPAVYYLAMNCDSGTASFHRANIGTTVARVMGVQNQAVGALALPATATFANPASGYVPLITASTLVTI